MSSITYLALLLGIIVVSLTASALAHYSQTKRIKKQKTLQRLRRSADHFAELAALLNKISSHKSMAAELIGMAINNYQRILQIEPDTEYASASLQNARELAQSLSRPSQPSSEDGLCNSDMEIYRTKSMLNDAEKIFRKILARGDLDQELFNEYHNELIWLYVQVEVDSLVQHGSRAKERKDKVKSLAYYQKALNVLKKSSVNDDRKQERIKLVGQLLTTKKEPAPITDQAKNS